MSQTDLDNLACTKCGSCGCTRENPDVCADCLVAVKNKDRRS